MTKLTNGIRGVWGLRALILILVCIFMAIVEPRFFRPDNFLSILLAISVYGIMSCGMLYVVLIGGLDLSMGSVAGLSATIVCVISMRGDYSMPSMLLSIVVAIAVSLAVGYFHGLLVTAINMPSFVVTLATKYLLYGLIPVVSGIARTYVREETFIDAIANAKLLGIPSRVIIFVVFGLICWFLLSKTTFGRRIYAIGGNPTAAEFVGIKVHRNTKIAYMISAFSACIGGIVLASATLTAGQTTGFGYEGMVLMAMIVGGINLAGGKGDISGAVFGALLVGIIQNIINLASFLNPDYLKFYQGFIILIVVVITVVVEKRDRRGISRKAKKAAQMASENE
ncbi:MAG: ABC transporter permease [Clostridiales Family XIII bacterium]|jgi:ribose/xylose/arabinose/galactoside ABC-type transport system permease subunit|nr:ABC transporter permease [Clostridiales Family XIII bacterium]